MIMAVPISISLALDPIYFVFQWINSFNVGWVDTDDVPNEFSDLANHSSVDFDYSEKFELGMLYSFTNHDALGLFFQVGGVILGQEENPYRDDEEHPFNDGRADRRNIINYNVMDSSHIGLTVEYRRAP